MRVSVFHRRSPLLLLAVALVALAAFVAPGGQPAQAQQSTVWSATLTVKEAHSDYLGCSDTDAAAPCSSNLSDNTFTLGGSEYQVTWVVTFSITNDFYVVLDQAIPEDFASNDRSLLVDGFVLSLSDADITTTGNTVGNTLSWDDPGLGWSAGDTASLSLTEPATTPTQPERPQTFPHLERLPVVDSVEPRSPSQRSPSGEGASASDAYCYLAEGNGTTEYIRYPDGRIVETARVGDITRSMFACD